jgi:hypothetical protein
MKAIIKLSIVVLVINAAVQAGRSYYDYHQFRHDVHMETLNGGRERSDEIQQRVLEMAAARGHVMTWDDVRIALDDDFITIDMKWVDTVDLVPRLYSHPWPYEGRVEVKRVKPVKIIE